MAEQKTRVRIQFLVDGEKTLRNLNTLVESFSSHLSSLNSIFDLIGNSKITQAFSALSSASSSVSDAILGVLTKFDKFNKASIFFNRNLIAVVEILAILSPALGVYTETLDENDSALKKNVVTTLNYASAISLALVGAFNALINIMAGWLQNIADPMVQAFKDIAEESRKFDRQIVATNATIRAYNQLTDGAIGGTEGYSKVIETLAKKYNLLRGDLNKGLQEIIAVGSQFGFQREDLEKLIETSAIYAKVFNKDVFDVSVKLVAGLAGGSQAVRDLGIKMGQASLQTFAYSQGLSENFKALSDNEKAQIRFAKLIKAANTTLPIATAVTRSLGDQQARLAQETERINVAIGRGAAFIEQPAIAFKLLSSILKVVGEDFAEVVGIIGALLSRALQLTAVILKLITTFLLLKTGVRLINAVLAPFQVSLGQILKKAATASNAFRIFNVVLRKLAGITLVIEAFFVLTQAIKNVSDRTNAFTDIWNILTGTLDKSNQKIEETDGIFKKLGQGVVGVTNVLIGIFALFFSLVIRGFLNIITTQRLFTAFMKKETVEALKVVDARLRAYTAELAQARLNVGNLTTEQDKANKSLKTSSKAFKENTDAMLEQAIAHKNLITFQQGQFDQQKKLSDSFLDLEKFATKLAEQMKKREVEAVLKAQAAAIELVAQQHKNLIKAQQDQFDTQQKLIESTKELNAWAEEFNKKLIETAERAPTVANGLSGIRRAADGFLESTTIMSQFQDATNEMFLSFENEFISFIDGTKTAKEAFKAFANSVIEDLLRIAVRQAITNNLATAFGGLAGALGGTSGGAVAALGAAGAANGAVFSGGIASFGKGGVVSSPTAFAFQSGGSFNQGIMGEKGPEAILPLTRRNGVLGVEGGGSNVQVTVINQTSAGASVSETSDSDGNKVIEVLITNSVKKGISSGSFDSVFSNSFGLSRAGQF